MPTTTIGDIIPILIGQLGNRNDLATKCTIWLAAAYIEVAMAYPFDELEKTILDSAAIGVDYLDYPTDDNGEVVRAIKSIVLILSDGSTQPLQKKNIKVIDRYHSTSKGPPSIYAPFESLVYLRPVPDKTYDLKWRVWRRPHLDTVVNDTVIELPDDWLEIVGYSAAIRGFTDLLEADKAAAIMQLLHGVTNPKTGAKLTPGLIAQKLLRKTVESEDSDYPIAPLTPTRRYSG